MGRPSRAEGARKVDAGDTTPLAAPLLSSLLRKLEQSDFVHEERWSTLQHILAALAHRVDAINCKLDALVEWHLACNSVDSVRSKNLLGASRHEDDQESADEDDLESLADLEALAEFASHHVDPLSMPDDEESLPPPVDEPPPRPAPRAKQSAPAPPPPPPPPPPVPVPPRSAVPIDDEPMDWVRQRERLMRSLEDGPEQHEIAHEPQRPFSVPGSSEDESMDDADAAVEGFPDLDAEQPILELEDDRQDEEGDESESEVASDESPLPVSGDSSALSEIEALRQQLAAALQKSELEMSIMRAKMSQERARLEQMEAEMRQREKQLERVAANGQTDKDGAMVSRLKSFLNPKNPG